MDIRVLQYFLAVAREQTISGAAESLHMTQPPLSKQLRELEEELGKQLFVRGKRRITLTREGMLLRKRAEEIVSLMEKTRAEVSASGTSVSGDICIGGGETEGMRHIAKTVFRLQRDYPDIHFHFFSGDGYDVTERLDRGLLDFGTLIEPIDLSRYDSLRLPRPDIWGLLMRKDHPLARKEAVCPGDLLDIPLISSRQPDRRRRKPGQQSPAAGGGGGGVRHHPGRDYQPVRGQPSLLPPLRAPDGVVDVSGLEEVSGVLPGGGNLSQGAPGFLRGGTGRGDAAAVERHGNITSFLSVRKQYLIVWEVYNS